MLCERTQDDKAENHKQDITENEVWGSVFFSSFYLKFVTDSPDSCDRPGFMVFDLFPETFDVDIYCAGIPDVFIIPRCDPAAVRG